MPFVGIIAVYVSQIRIQNRISMQKHTVVLDCVPAESHKAVDMQAVLLRVLTDFGLKLEDVICVVCDNASANGLLVQRLNRELEAASSTHCIHVSYCMNHLIHWAVVTFMATAHRIIMPFRRAARAIHNSPELSRLLAESVRQEDEFRQRARPRPSAIIYDVPTRWNSTADMLDRLLLLCHEIDMLAEDHPGRLPQKLWEQWETIGMLFLASFLDSAMLLLTNHLL